MSDDVKSSKHFRMSEPSQKMARVQGDTSRLWRLCMYYLCAHLVAIIICAWFAYLDSKSTSGALYQVATYVASPGIVLMFVSPFLTVAFGLLSCWRGRRYLAIAVCEGALCGLHFFVMFPAYS